MISRTALHALKATLVLAERPEAFQGTASIAERIDAPPNYLGKLLQDLVRSGIVRSQKGLGGGFQLAKDPGKIRLFDVVEPVDHVSRWEGCFMGQSRCSAERPCVMHHSWVKVRNAYMAMLKESTLADVVAGTRPLPAA